MQSGEALPPPGANQPGMVIGAMSAAAHDTRRVVRLRRNGLVLLALSVTGCGGFLSAEPPPSELETFDCGRGFVRSDWNKQPPKTAQSLVACRWADGWTERRVLKNLRRPTGRNEQYRVWDLGPSNSGLGPMNWFLAIEIGTDGRVLEATITTRAV